MHLTTHENTLQVRGLEYLSATNAAAFKEAVRPRINQAHPIVEVDCSTVRFIDSEGLGALISIHRTVLQYEGKVRLAHTSALVHKLIQLIHFDEIFDIAP